MRASLIIVTRGRNESLHDTLQTLSRVCVPDGLETELIVVGNSPEGPAQSCGTAQSCGSLPLRHLHEPRPGKSHGLNTAVSRATGDMLIFTDDDVRPPQGWLREMAEAIADGRDAVFGKVVLDPVLLRPWMEPLHRSWLASSEVESQSGGIAMIGANMAVSREVFSRVPRFEPQLGPGALGFGEDLLFGMQLQAAGFRIAAGKGEPLVHRPCPSRLLHDAWIRTAEAQGRSRGWIGHHWDHWNCRLAHIRRARMRIHLRRWRRKQPDQRNAEGCPAEEMKRVMALATVEEHLRQAHRPRNYELRGFVRVRDDE